MGIKNKTATWAKDKFGDKIAPNGKPVWENFVIWFDKSKVVDDETGEPLVVYHGTAAEFTAFDMGSRGAFLTPSEQVARTYGAPMPVYLSLKNPVVIDAQWAFWNELDSVRSSELDKLRKHGRIVVLDHIKSAAEKAGYDGAIVRNVVDNGGASDQYIAFRPEQIKSATANSGIFDPNSTSIDDTPLHGSDPSNKNLVADNQGNFELSSLDLSALEFDQVLERTQSNHQNSLTLKNR